MSDNVAIKEGARAYNFTVDKIRTAQQSSDEPVIWVPESTVQLGSLHASDNGVYLARSEDLYGYGEIVVSVNGAATIGDRAVFPDDSGQLHEEYLPHAIVIVTPPRKLEYEDGQRIDLRGLVVKAVDENGGTWTNAKYPNGHIPLQELIIDPDHADIGQAQGGAVCPDFGVGPWPQPVVSAQGRVEAKNGSIVYEYSGHIAVLVDGEDDYRRDFIFCSTAPGIGEWTWQATTPWPQETTVYVSEMYTYNNKTVFYNGSSASGLAHTGLTGGRNVLVAGNSLDRAKAAWTIVYGTPMAGIQTITVTWRRYGDGAELSTSFDITVLPGESA